MKSYLGKYAASALGMVALLSATPLQAQETPLQLTRAEGGDRFVRDPKLVKWSLNGKTGYHAITNCGLTAGSKGPRAVWNEAPLDTGSGGAGYIESPDQCHRIMGHQKPRPDLAGKILRGNSGDWNWYIDRQGNKHSIHSRTNVWKDCAVGKVKSQMTPFDEIFRISGQNEIKDVAGCVAVAGK